MIDKAHRVYELLQDRSLSFWPAGTRLWIFPNLLGHVSLLPLRMDMGSLEVFISGSFMAGSVMLLLF